MLGQLETSYDYGAFEVLLAKTKPVKAMELKCLAGMCVLASFAVCLVGNHSGKVVLCVGDVINILDLVTKEVIKLVYYGCFYSLLKYGITFK